MSEEFSNHVSYIFEKVFPVNTNNPMVYTENLLQNKDEFLITARRIRELWNRYPLFRAIFTKIMRHFSRTGAQKITFPQKGLDERTAR